MHVLLTIFKALLLLTAIGCFVVGMLKAMKYHQHLRAIIIISIAVLLIAVFVFLDLYTKTGK